MSNPAPAWKLHSSNTEEPKQFLPAWALNWATSVQDLEERVMVTAKGGCTGPCCWDQDSMFSSVVRYVCPVCLEFSEEMA